MSTVEAQGILLDELTQTLQAADPRVRLIPARILHRVIRGVHGVGAFGRHVPHRGGFSTTARAALVYSTHEELGIDPAEPIPDFLILLVQPDSDETARPRAEVLTAYWRELFHARVHLAFEERSNLFPINGDWAESRINRLGRVEFAEARAVLYEDQYLMLPADDRTTYIEFAAVYLEQLAFHPALLPHTFPAIDDHTATRDIFASDVDFIALLDATRPPGAPDRPSATLDESDDESEPIDETETVDHAAPSERDPGRWDSLKASAEAASKRGNNVRAAILRTRAARLATAIEGPRTRAGARSELDKLTRRLRAAIGFDAEEAGRWRRALPAFLDRASKGLWPREARLLYDLQKVCSDQERAIYSVDLVGWAISLGKRPLKRLLPDHREILVLSHLRHADYRLRRMRRPEPERGRLELLVEHAIQLKERQIRERFRDRIRDALDRVSLRPANLPERAARRKLVEELLDLIVERGYLRIGDLRDTISRSHIKLHDLSGLREFIRGDALLQADAELARSLEGVYHRGEIYLRGLQRASSLAFGTKLGRVLTRTIALPFGGAFIVLEGLQHIVGPLLGLIFGTKPELMNTLSFTSLGLLLLGLINVPKFRAAFFRICGLIGQIFKAIFYSAPAWVFDRSAIRSIVSSRPVLLTRDWVVKPIILLSVLSLGIPWLARPDFVGLAIKGVAFLALAVFMNSRQGRVVEEIAADGASRVGQRIWHDVLPNFFRGILEFFKACLELFERLIYTVDEWLRFRSGESRLALAGKAVAGLVWLVIAYVARIYLNLLIEPQINPIKHFPVVTVSHKIILPMSPTIFGIIKAPLRPLGEGIANTIAGTTVFLIPGLFGFLVWELKENWKLYEANRPQRLRPVAIGHHGETMSRLLRRGFHSGTVPKLFAKLRKRDREAEVGMGLGPSHKVSESIHHVEEAIRHFVDRGVLYLLEESRSIGRTRPTTARIECSTNRITIELRDHDRPETAARIAFEESDRHLCARVIEPGWMLRLDDEARQTITTVLAGLYAMSDVERVIDASNETSELVAPGVAWTSWVDAWEGDAAGIGHIPIVEGACPLLPPRPTIVPSR